MPVMFLTINAQCLLISSLYFHNVHVDDCDCIRPVTQWQPEEMYSTVYQSLVVL